jgi:transcriptional regulator with XRE-family HTH domain
MTTNEQLKLLAQKHRLTHAKIGEMLGMSRRSVSAWFFDANAKTYRNCPAAKLKLLKLLLKSR